MEKIDLQNFKKYYRNNDGNGTLARVGHVNAVIEEVDTKITAPVNPTVGDTVIWNGTEYVSQPASGGGGGGYKDLGNASTVSSIDWSEAATQEINLDANPTLTFANATPGDNLSLLLKSGTTQRSVNWPNSVLWNRGNPPIISPLPQNGGIDALFLSGTGFTGQGMMGPSTNYSIGTSYVLSTGKILVWNNNQQTAYYDGAFLPGSSAMSGNKDLVRLNADGTLDNTWATNNWSAMNMGVICIHELPDGRILIGGDFDSGGGNTATYGNDALQLLSADGVRDNTFVPLLGLGTLGNKVTSIAQQSTGKIIIGGCFGQIDGNTHQNIARFDGNLTLDSSFTAAIGNNMDYIQVGGLAINSEDAIFVIGGFNSITINGGGSYSYLAKLNYEGIVESFGPGSGINGPVGSIKIDSLDRVILGGGFNAYDGTSIGYGITRLLHDGALDTSFVTGSGTTSIVDYLLILPNNKIVVLGNSISYYNGTAVGRLFVLNETGAIDTEIVIPSSGLSGVSPNNTYGLALQTNGDILVTGPFNSYGGATANAIVSINVSTETEVYTEIDFKFNGVNYIGSFK